VSEQDSEYLKQSCAWAPELTAVMLLSLQFDMASLIDDQVQRQMKTAAKEHDDNARKRRMSAFARTTRWHWNSGSNRRQNVSWWRKEDNGERISMVLTIVKCRVKNELQGSMSIRLPWESCSLVPTETVARSLGITRAFGLDVHSLFFYQDIFILYL